MLIVALTGGIGSGKSSVGQILDDLGATVIDSDQLARSVIERGTKGFNEVVATFGDAVLKNGEIDRAALAEQVFSDPQKRVILEKIIHPLIREEFARVVKAADKDAIIVNQIPLLVESKHDYKFDHIVTVSAPEEMRIERLLQRGLSADQIKQRMLSQVTDDEREKIADTVIHNDQSKPHLLSEVEKLWTSLKNQSKV